MEPSFKPRRRYEPNPLYSRSVGGTTPSEKYLASLCDRTFLSLWSYPNLFTDSGAARGRGKELCDLLVVFKNHVLIFSDKDCKFGNSGDLRTDWSRWYRKAILESAQQVWGAERWIREYPERVFLDESCKKPFPLELSPIDDKTFHRIVVAHGASERVRAHFNSKSGSLLLNSGVSGGQHEHHPFCVGRIDPTRGYVHVLDDVTLDILLRTLDTVADFVRYLEKKEAFLQRHAMVMAEGEEELLEDYLTHLSDEGGYDFSPRGDFDAVLLPGSQWSEFENSAERKAQIEANEISYLWDDIIERTAYHMRSGTSAWNSHSGVANQEKLLRFFAGEPRLHRRALALALMDAVTTTKPDAQKLRFMPGATPDDPYIVFVVFGRRPKISNDLYRQARSSYLQMCCMVVKLLYPAARHVIGLATEPGMVVGRSEELLYLDAQHWTDEMQAAAQECRDELGILTRATNWEQHIKDYPVD